MNRGIDMKMMKECTGVYEMPNRMAKHLIELYEELEKRPRQQHEFGLEYKDGYFTMKSNVEMLSAESMVYSFLAQVSALQMVKCIPMQIAPDLHIRQVRPVLSLEFESYDRQGKSFLFMEGSMVKAMKMTLTAMVYFLPQWVQFFDTDLYRHYRNQVKKTYIL